MSSIKIGVQGGRLKLSGKQRQVLEARFKEQGASSHDTFAETLPTMVEYCERNKVPYMMLANPGCGYQVIMLTEQLKIELSLLVSRETLKAAGSL